MASQTPELVSAAVPSSSLVAPGVSTGEQLGLVNCSSVSMNHLAALGQMCVSPSGHLLMCVQDFHDILFSSLLSSVLYSK